MQKWPHHPELKGTEMIQNAKWLWVPILLSTESQLGITSPDLSERVNTDGQKLSRRWCYGEQWTREPVLRSRLEAKLGNIFFS